MSFILDALRKSERERQRNQNPGVAAPHLGQSRSRSVWVPLVIALVVINICLLLFLGLRDDDTPTPAVVVPAERPPVAQAQEGNRQLRAEIKPTAKPREPAAPQQRTETVSAPPARAKPQADKEPARDEYGNLPTLTELSLAGSMTLPPLRIDIHVYSDMPAERFVFINMDKYREGDTLNEGPGVEAITESGVVLSYQGREFLLTGE